MKSIIVSVFCFFIALIRCSETESSTVSPATASEEDPFFIPDSCLGGFKNFGFKYLTMKVPSDRSEANDMSFKMSRMVELLDSKCWSLRKSYSKEYLIEAYTEILGIYSEFRCQALRRTLIYGLIENFMSYQERKADQGRAWRARGIVIVAALKIVNSMIPENYFESSQVLVEDSVEFTEDMHKSIAYSWVVDFEPLYSFLKSLNYATLLPLKILIEKEQYFPALKLITSGQGSIDPAVNFPAWLAMIEARDNTRKLNFIYGLIELGKLNINWKFRGMDMLQYALSSKKYLMHSVNKILSMTSLNLDHKPDFYLEFLQSEAVASMHTPEYQESLVNCINRYI